MKEKFLELLRCPSCRAPLSMLAVGDVSTGLRCQQCERVTPIKDGIPRFVDNGSSDVTGSTDVAQRTRASFGYELTHFNDWKPSGSENFEDYFSEFDLDWLRGGTVLDGGCGMGRHALQVAPFADRVVALDFSKAIEQAARNVGDRSNVQCVQGDLTRLPLADEAFDFVYSMGVLHHLEDTALALRRLARTLKPGGRLRLYLYWKRTGVVGALLSLVGLARKITTRLPFGLLRVLCWVLSVILFAAVVVPYRLLMRLGLRLDGWPLVVYTKYPFNVLYNDQFDRFSAPLEKRYSEAEVRSLLEGAGLRDITIHRRFGWIGDGVK